MYLTHLNILNVTKLELRRTSHGDEYCWETWRAELSAAELHGQHAIPTHTPESRSAQVTVNHRPAFGTAAFSWLLGAPDSLQAQSVGRALLRMLHQGTTQSFCKPAMEKERFLSPSKGQPPTCHSSMERSMSTSEFQCINALH